jgi:hypothetical protein
MMRPRRLIGSFGEAGVNLLITTAEGPYMPPRALSALMGECSGGHDLPRAMAPNRSHPAIHGGQSRDDTQNVSSTTVPRG